MLTPGQVRDFQRDGFVNGGALLDDAFVAELSDDLDRIIAKGPAGFDPRLKKPVLFRVEFARLPR